MRSILHNYGPYRGGVGRAEADRLTLALSIRGIFGIDHRILAGRVS